MNNTNWKLLVIVGIWWVILTWVGAYAATTSEVSNIKRPQMMREFWTWEKWDFKNPHGQLPSFLVDLSDSDKKSVESLLTEYRDWEKLFFQWLDSAKTEEEKTSEEEKWETKKSNLKEELLKLLWEENKEEVDKIFTKNHKDELWKQKRQWIIGLFITEENLSDNDKEELKKIEEKKQEDIQSIQDNYRESLEKVNDEYFDSIKKYIDDDKLDEFNEFLETADKYWMKMNFNQEKWWKSGMRGWFKNKQEFGEKNSQWDYKMMK